MWLLILPTLFLLSSVFGVEQGILWSRKGANAFTWNEHIVFGVKRGLLIVALFFAMHIPDYISFIFIIVSFILAFPFFQAGAYYQTRWIISKQDKAVSRRVYPNGWFSEPSRSTTANLNLSLFWRSVFFVLALVLYVYTFTL